MHVPLVAHMNEAYANGDCSEAMHECVGVCVWACTRRMVTVSEAASVPACAPSQQPRMLKHQIPALMN
jgi:hypothetical protein